MLDDEMEDAEHAAQPERAIPIELQTPQELITPQALLNDTYVPRPDTALFSRRTFCFHRKQFGIVWRAHQSSIITIVGQHSSALCSLKQSAIDVASTKSS